MVVEKGLESTLSLGWLDKKSKRHPQLSLRKGEPLSKTRLATTSREILDKYFDLLEEVLVQNNILNKPSQIFNFDETGVPLSFSPPRVLARKGQKYVYSVRTGDKSQVTVLACACSAAGYVLPPHVIFKQSGLNKEWIVGEVPNTKYSLTETGWINSSVFEGWFFAHFLQCAPSTRPLLLLLDGHLSHYNPTVIQTAADNGIIIFCLPPNTTHLAQPLDRCAFGALKQHWSTECQRYMTTTGGKMVTKNTFSRVFARAWSSAMTVGNVAASFRRTGIFPFDRTAIRLPEDPRRVTATPSRHQTIEFVPLLTPRAPVIANSRRKSDVTCKSVAPALARILDLTTFTEEEEKLFEKRYENGYDLADDRYSAWIRANHSTKPIMACPLAGTVGHGVQLLPKIISAGVEQPRLPRTTRTSLTLRIPERPCKDPATVSALVLTSDTIRKEVQAKEAKKREVAERKQQRQKEAAARKQQKQKTKEDKEKAAAELAETNQTKRTRKKIKKIT